MIDPVSSEASSPSANASSFDDAVSTAKSTTLSASETAEVEEAIIGIAGVMMAGAIFDQIGDLKRFLDGGG